MNKSVQKYEVIVIGGGPAGMMAAGTAAKNGARVLLLEKNPILGAKLRITGGGRCNITNAEFDSQKLVAKYGKKGKALFSVFSRFGVQDTLDFFHAQGLETMEEEGKRVFPLSESAEDVTATMIQYIKKHDVEVKTKAEVSGFVVREGTLAGVKVGAKEILADKVILATGGKSHPETGSTGECFDWLKSLGLEIAKVESALVPVKVKEKWISRLMGLSYPNARVTVWQKNQPRESRAGKILFTHFGLSGPLILNMSRDIGDYLKYGAVNLSIDLDASLDRKAFDSKVQEIFRANQNKKLKNVIGEILQPKLVELLEAQEGIDFEKEINKVTKDERTIIVSLVKSLLVTPASLMGAEKAVVTSGGLDVKEVDPKTMRVKKYPNLYVIGDTLDIDRPSGGFSLQICWSTGYVAGEDVGK